MKFRSVYFALSPIVSITPGLCCYYISSNSTEKIDVFSRYAGLVRGISNTVASLPGIVAPIVVAELTPNVSFGWTSCDN